MSKYCKRVWLNRPGSASTGSVVAYHGKVSWNRDKEETTSFLEVADCHNKIRLHKTYAESNADFIKKMRKLAKVVADFADYLEREKV